VPAKKDSLGLRLWRRGRKGGESEGAFPNSKKRKGKSGVKKRKKNGSGDDRNNLPSQIKKKGRGNEREKLVYPQEIQAQAEERRISIY